MLSYDIAFYDRQRHPDAPTDCYAFIPLTPFGRERLTMAPAGKWSGEALHVNDDDGAEEIMDHIETLEVHLDY